jgi:hypothetical protein
MTGWLLAGVAALGVVPPALAPRWHTDLGEARAEARRTGRPLLVVFR